MDSLNYNYYKGTNQLRNVRDGVSATNYSNDIDDEPSKYNYRYNGIGQLGKDSAGNIDTIIWNVYGKVQTIIFNELNNTDKSIKFVYDPMGNRLEKIVSTQHVCLTCHDPVITDTTKYVRDAQGNILAVYHRKQDTVHLTEWDIYGSKRIGIVDTNMLVYEPVPACPLCPIITNPVDTATTAYLEGQKQYELTNHLGNVLVTISDRKMAFDTIAIHTIPHTACFYEPVIINAQDYYPFGSLEPGRQYAILRDSAYRFGFDGQLKDDDIFGKGNAYTALDWELSILTNKRWNPDPLVNPSLSPYAIFANNPILNTDFTGQIPGGANDPPEKTEETFGKVNGDGSALADEIDDDLETIYQSGFFYKPPTQVNYVKPIPDPWGRMEENSTSAPTYQWKQEDVKNKAEEQQGNANTTKDKSNKETQSKSEQQPPKSNDVHGNSKQSTKDQHGYEIVEKVNGKTGKFGISGKPLNKNGTSTRANTQVNKLNKEAGYEKYEAKIHKTGMKGRKAGLKWEVKKTKDYQIKNNGDNPPLQQLPK